MTTSNGARILSSFYGQIKQSYNTRQHSYIPHQWFLAIEKVWYIVSMATDYEIPCQR
jgi:hypothetical protein